MKEMDAQMPSPIDSVSTELIPWFKLKICNKFVFILKLFHRVS